MIPSFPDYVFINDQGLERMMMPNVLRSEMDVGPQKTRPIQSVPMFQAAMDISIRSNRITDFCTWFMNSIGSGAYWFLLNDPFDGVVRRFRFVEYDFAWTKMGNLMQTRIVLEAYDEL